jgi:hypothetical protein
MSTLHDLWHDLTIELQTLRTLFPSSEAGITAAEYFDEYLSVNELGLALHVVCDFLLEPDQPPTSHELQAQLQRLHSRMEITDDCVNRLHDKAITGIPRIQSSCRVRFDGPVKHGRKCPSELPRMPSFLSAGKLAERLPTTLVRPFLSCLEFLAPPRRLRRRDDQLLAVGTYI